MNSFRTYDPSRGASLHTWATRLCGQAIWAFIKEKVEKVDRTYMEDLTSLNAVDSEDPECILIKREEANKHEKIKERLVKVLGGPIEVEVFAMMNGLFGYQEMKIKDIAEEMSFTVKTIYDINIRNNKKMRELRKDKGRIDEILK
jgi:DNA-directed RNA polymerase specialized sigma subunit